MRSSARAGRDDREFSRKWRVRRSWEEEEQWTTRRRDRHERSTASSEPANGELVERTAERERERFIFNNSFTSGVLRFSDIKLQFLVLDNNKSNIRNSIIFFRFKQNTKF